MTTFEAVVELNRRVCNTDRELPCVQELIGPVVQAVGAESVRAAVSGAVAGLAASALVRSVELPKAIAAFSVSPVSCGFMRAPVLRHRSGFPVCPLRFEQGRGIVRELVNASAHNWVLLSDLSAALARFHDCWADCDLLWDGVTWFEAGPRGFVIVVQSLTLTSSDKSGIGSRGCFAGSHSRSL